MHPNLSLIGLYAVSNITIIGLQPPCRMQMGHNDGRAPEHARSPGAAGAEGLGQHNRDFLIIQWPLFHWNYFQNEQRLKSIPHTPQILAFTHQRGTQQLEKVMAFSSAEKSHFKFISIIMSLVNNFVRKIYLHTSHLCFHVIFELPINSGFYG